MYPFPAQLFQLRQASETEAYVFAGSILFALLWYALYYNYRKRHPKVSGHHIAVLGESLGSGSTSREENAFSTKRDIPEGAVLSALIAGRGVFTVTVAANEGKWLVLQVPDWGLRKRKVKKRPVVLFFGEGHIHEIHGRIKKVKRRNGLQLYLSHRMHAFTVRAHPGRGMPLGINCYISPYKAVSRLERVMGSVSSGKIELISYFGMEISTDSSIDGGTDLLAEFKFKGDVFRVSGKVVRVQHLRANRVLHLRFYQLDESVGAVVRHLVGLASH